jgi:hypothetical protein
VFFLNDTGVQIPCGADGRPEPQIQWQNLDGSSITNILDLRLVSRNGTLVFLPFSADAYHQHIHNGLYRCVATNDLGVVVSREVQVRGGQCLSLSIYFPVNPESIQYYKTRIKPIETYVN